MTARTARDDELQALRELSASLGADRLRTQGAGGNASIKRDETLWIKASGTWLSDALAREIMTPVRLNPLLEAIATGDPRAATAVDFVDSSLNPDGLRPSIETSFHAIIPAPVVVHIHCVHTIALAVRRDGEEIARERLRGLGDVACVFAPYRKPGLPLAQAILERLTKGANVFVLANHGLIVAGETVQEAADRIARVCDAFAAPARPAAAADLERLASLVEGTGYRLPHDPAAHALALDPKSLAIASRGSLYPDHVVFLGPGLAQGNDCRRPSRSASLRSAASDAGAAGRGRRGSSFGVEERGGDGAVPRRCRRAHSRRGGTPGADRGGGARTHELGSRDLSAVSRGVEWQVSRQKLKRKR